MRARTVTCAIFSYAVVVQNSNNVNTYYATLTSPPIAELAVATGKPQVAQ